MSSKYTIQTISAPGAAILVQRIVLTPEQRERLTLSDAAAKWLRELKIERKH